MKIDFMAPLDQPMNNLRLLEIIKDCLRSPEYDHFKIAVAFAKIGPLLRLHQEITTWVTSGKTIESLIGFSHKGTSQQALQYVLGHFTRNYVIFTASGTSFHPKIYLFYGGKSAVAFIGSNNLTIGGTELNCEAGTLIYLDLSLDSDKKVFDRIIDMWQSLVKSDFTQQLNQELLDHLTTRGLLLDESRVWEGSGRYSVGSDVGRLSSFSLLSPAPPSPIPQAVIAPPVIPKKKKSQMQVRAGTFYSGVMRALVIQIIPHHNGEIFLSKTALRQNPSFFGYPFSGKTIPKRPGNPSYPQRDPDPLVNLRVFDETGSVIESKLFNLNMVYYERKSEVRITINPTLAKQIPRYSILVMQRVSKELGYDYDIDIYYPGSKQYFLYLNKCNQTLPSGGSEEPRRMGWL